ncbi:MurR/RpiR family transcriptional regulator [Lacrimispora saccharolytica]|nr:MurR/RpiR family transcriptional regulator [Lacrimispora saccharolytica]
MKRGVFMNLDALINENYDKLNNNDFYILQYVKEHIPLCLNFSISELSEKCSVSTASILRTAKKLGFSGYSEFKYYLRQEKTNEKNISIKRELVSELNNDIQQTIKLFEQNTVKNVIFNMMKEADVIYAYGTGHGQRLILSEFARCLMNVKKNLIVIPASTELNIAMDTMKKNDLLFIASLSGNLKFTKEVILNLMLKEIPTVSITNLSNNELASLVKYNFYYQSSSISKDRNLNTSSFLTLHLLLHLIYEEYTDYIS